MAISFDDLIPAPRASRISFDDLIPSAPVPSGGRFAGRERMRNTLFGKAPAEGGEINWGATRQAAIGQGEQMFGGLMGWGAEVLESAGNAVGLGDAIRFAGQITSNPTVEAAPEAVPQGMREVGADVRSAGQFRVQQAQPDLIQQPESFLADPVTAGKYILQSGIISGAPTAVGLGLGAVGAPAAGLAVMGALVGGDKFAQTLEETGDVGRAHEAALFAAGAEAIPELIPMALVGKRAAQIFGDDVAGYVAKLAEESPGLKWALTAGAEGGSEVLTEAANIAYESIREGKEITGNEVWKRIRDAGSVGTLMGGAIGAPVAVGDYMRPQREERPKSKVEIDLDTGAAAAEEIIAKSSADAGLGLTPAAGLAPAAPGSAAERAQAALDAAVGLGQRDSELDAMLAPEYTPAPRESSPVVANTPQSPTEPTPPLTQTRPPIAPAPRSIIPDPDEWNLQDFRQRATEYAGQRGMDDKARADLESLRQPMQRDAVTGFYRPEERVPFVKRAVDHVKNTGGDAVYVESDIRNLGGLNDRLGSTGANKVYRRIAETVQRKLESLGGQVVPVRNGGDEFSFTVLGVPQQAVDAALAQADVEVQDYIAAEGLADVKSPKGKAPGVGIIYASGTIAPDLDLDALFSSVDTEIETRKRGYGRTEGEADGAGRSDPGAAGREGPAGIPQGAVIPGGMQAQGRGAQGQDSGASASVAAGGLSDEQSGVAAGGVLRRAGAQAGVLAETSRPGDQAQAAPESQPAQQGVSQEGGQATALAGLRPAGQVPDTGNRGEFQQRQDDQRPDLSHLEREIGWEERGGRGIRARADWQGEDGAPQGPFVARTDWTPRTDFWPNKPDPLTEAQAKRVLRKYREGRRLGAREQRFIDYALEYERNMAQDADRAERETASETAETALAAEAITLQELRAELRAEGVSLSDPEKAEDALTLAGWIERARDAGVSDVAIEAVDFTAPQGKQAAEFAALIRQAEDGNADTRREQGRGPRDVADSGQEGGEESTEADPQDAPAQDRAEPLQLEQLTPEQSAERADAEAARLRDERNRARASDRAELRERTAAADRQQAVDRNDDMAENFSLGQGRREVETELAGQTDMLGTPRAEPSPQFRRVSSKVEIARDAGTDADRVASIASQVSADWASSAPAVRVHGSRDSLPPRVLKALEAVETAEGRQDVSAVYHAGEIHLVADSPRLQTEAGARRAIAHELTHWAVRSRGGLAKLLGKDAAAGIERELLELAESDPAFREAAETVRREYRSDPEAIRAEEVLTHLAERYDGLTGRAREWMDYVVGLIREAIISRTGGKLTRTDVIRALRSARAMAREGGSERGEAASFSRQSDTIEVDGTQRPRTNSTGKPIHHTEEGLRNFWRWFGDSKVVDDQGRPIEVYHGTGSDIAEFSRDRAQDREGRKLGLGLGAGKFYLTGQRVAASNFAENASRRKLGNSANVMPLYAQAENPITESDYRERFAELSGGQSLNDQSLSRAKRDSLIARLDKQLKDEGVDGIVDRYRGGELGQVAVFSPSQVKSSIGNTGEFSAETGDIRFSRRDDDRDLIAVHNTTVGKLRHAMKMGGFAVPSIAVMKKDQALTGFGDITLIGDRNLVDPKRGAKAFGADVYSPRYPSITLEFTKGMRDRGNRMLKDGMEATGVDYIAWEDVSSDGKIENQMPFVWQFLREQGITPNVITVKPKMLPNELMPFVDSGMDRFDLARDDAFKQVALGMEGDAAETAELPERVQQAIVSSATRQIEEYRNAERDSGKIDRYATDRAMKDQVRENDLGGKLDEAAREFIETIGPNEKIFQGHTNSGRRRYIPHTLESVVKLLKKELRGGENFNYGVGSLRAKYTPQFRSIDQMRKEKGRLLSAEAFEETKKEIDGEFEAVSSALEPHYKHGVRFGYLDTVISVFSDAATQGLPRALREYGFDDVPADIQRQAAVFLNKLRTLPTEYFEVNQPRAVDLSEFRAAVVPEGTDAATTDAIERSGLKVYRYTKGEDATRRAAIQQAAESEDVMFQRRMTHGRGVETVGEYVKRELNDKWLDEFGALVRAEVATVGGSSLKTDSKAATVSDDLAARRAENLRHGRYQEQMRQAQRDYLEPAAKILGDTGLNQEQLADYLWWRHAPERDAYLRAKHKGNPAADALAGIDPDEARRNIAALPAADRQALEQAAERIDAMRDHTLSVLESSGQVDPATVQVLRGQYEHYVPLRGLPGALDDPNIDNMQQLYGVGQGLSVKQNPLGKKAMGRKSKPTNIVEQMQRDLQRAVVGAEKQRVLQRVINLMMQNPAIGRIDPVEHIKREVNGVIQWVPKEITENTVTFLHKGKPVRLKFADPRLERAMLDMNEPFHPFLRRLAGMTRWLSAVKTSLSPYFMLINPVRDVNFAAMGILAEEGPAQVASFLKFYKQSWGALYRDERGRSGASPIDRYVREFAKAGGKTGYTMVNDINTLSKDIGQLFTKYSKDGGPAGIAKRIWYKAGDIVEAGNNIAENTARVAAYAARREGGASIEEAAAYAKNITVNFNVKGSEGKKMNGLFMFFNAAVQGTRRMAQLMTNKTFASTMLSLAGASYAIALAQLRAAGDDDDGESKYLKQIGEFDSQRSIPIRYGDGDEDYVAIPMPYGPNMFSYLGWKLAVMTYQAERGRSAPLSKDLADIALNMSNSMSPIQVERGWFALAPEVLRLPVQMLANTDDWGNPMSYAEKYKPADDTSPAYLDADYRTGEGYRLLSQFANFATGGDEYEAGLANIAPEKIRYLVQQGLGGMYRLANESGELVQKVMDGAPINPRDVPLANVYVRSRDLSHQQGQKFYENRAKIENLRRIYKQADERGDTVKQEELLAEYPWLDGSELSGNSRAGRLAQQGTPIGQLRETEREIKALRNERQDAYTGLGDYEGLVRSDRMRRVREIDREIASLQRRLNAAMNDMPEPAGLPPAR